MSHLINMPVVLKCSSLKGQWRRAGEEDGIPLVEQHTFGTDFDPITVHIHDLPLNEEQEREFNLRKADATTVFDPWQALQTFTALKSTDALLTFLNSTGHFCDPIPEEGFFRDTEDAVEYGWVRYGSTDFWQVQDLLVEMLLSGRPIVDVPKDSMPPEWEKVFRAGFNLSIERRLHGDFVAEVVTDGTLAALVAVTQLRVLKGGKFHLCKRPDCRRVYEVETRGRRKNQYCSHLCAHTAWQRRDRKTKVQVIDERSQFGYGA